MENTCNFKDCPVAKRLKCKRPEECINYIETWFTPISQSGEEGQPALIKDCINKRMLLMIQDISNSMSNLHKSQSELRNQTQSVNNIAGAMINTATKNLNIPKDQKILISGDT